MQNDNKIFEMRKDIERSQSYLEMKKQILERQKEKLTDICNHSLVFNIKDSKIHRSSINIHFCPACLKMVKLFSNKKDEDYPFSDSHIINLGNINIMDNTNLFDCIQDIVFTDPYYYYNFGIADDRKSLEVKVLIDQFQKTKTK